MFQKVECKNFHQKFSFCSERDKQSFAAKKTTKEGQKGARKTKSNGEN